MDRLGQNVHVFDLDAEPEPVPDEVNAAADTSNGDGDIIDDGFGPVDDNDDDDDGKFKLFVYLLVSDIGIATTWNQLTLL